MIIEPFDSSGEFKQEAMGMSEDHELAEKRRLKIEKRADLLALTLQKVINERKI